VSPRPRVGTIPEVRLADARRARDRLRAALPRCRCYLTIVGDGFGVQVYHPYGQPVVVDTGEEVTGLRYTDAGVPVRFGPAPVNRPRR
jgi:hypothetical protein